MRYIGIISDNDEIDIEKSKLRKYIRIRNSDLKFKFSVNNKNKIVEIDNRPYNFDKDGDNLIFYIKEMPVRFDFAKFRKRTLFYVEKPGQKDIHLGMASFRGVDLSNVEFHNVEWFKKYNNTLKNLFIERSR